MKYNSKDWFDKENEVVLRIIVSLCLIGIPKSEGVAMSDSRIAEFVKANADISRSQFYKLIKWNPAIDKSLPTNTTLDCLLGLIDRFNPQIKNQLGLPLNPRDNFYSVDQFKNYIIDSGIRFIDGSLKIVSEGHLFERVKTKLLSHYNTALFVEIHIIGSEKRMLPLSMSNFFIGLTFIEHGFNKRRQLYQKKEQETSFTKSRKAEVLGRQLIDISVFDNIDNDTLILGIPGVGKTILSKWICYHWSHKKDHKDLIFHIRLRDVEFYPQGNSLLGHCLSLLENGVIREHLETLTSKIVLVLDGFDELVSSKQAYVMNDIKSIEWKSIVLLSRPYGMINWDTNGLNIYEVNGFNDNLAYDYIKSVLEANSKIEIFDDVLSVFRSNKTLYELSFNPLLLSQFIAYAALGENSFSKLIKVKSIYELMDLTVGWVASSYRAKGDANAKFYSKEIPIGRLAYHLMMEQKSIYVGHASFDDYLEEAKQLSKNGLGTQEKYKDSWKFHFNTFIFQEFIATQCIKPIASEKLILYLLQFPFFWNFVRLIIGGYNSGNQSLREVDSVLTHLKNNEIEQYIYLLGEMPSEYINKKFNTLKDIDNLVDIYIGQDLDTSVLIDIRTSIEKIYNSLRKPLKNNFIDLIFNKFEKAIKEFPDSHALIITEHLSDITGDLLIYEENQYSIRLVKLISEVQDKIDLLDIPHSNYFYLRSYAPDLDKVINSQIAKSDFYLLNLSLRLKSWLPHVNIGNKELMKEYEDLYVRLKIKKVNNLTGKDEVKLYINHLNVELKSLLNQEEVSNKIIGDYYFALYDQLGIIEDSIRVDNSVSIYNFLELSYKSIIKKIDLNKKHEYKTFSILVNALALIEDSEEVLEFCLEVIKEHQLIETILSDSIDLVFNKAEKLVFLLNTTKNLDSAENLLIFFSLNEYNEVLITKHLESFNLALSLYALNNQKILKLASEISFSLDGITKSKLSAYSNNFYYFEIFINSLDRDFRNSEFNNLIETLLGNKSLMDFSYINSYLIPSIISQTNYFGTKFWNYIDYLLDGKTLKRDVILYLLLQRPLYLKREFFIEVIIRWLLVLRNRDFQSIDSHQITFYVMGFVDALIGFKKFSGVDSFHFISLIETFFFEKLTIEILTREIEEGHAHIFWLRSLVYIVSGKNIQYLKISEHDFNESNIESIISAGIKLFSEGELLTLMDKYDDTIIERTFGHIKDSTNAEELFDRNEIDKLLPFK